MLFSNDEGMFPTSKKDQGQNVSKCTTENVQGTGGVDLIRQSALAYHLDQKLAISFYLLIFFDLVVKGLCLQIYCLQYDASK